MMSTRHTLWAHLVRVSVFATFLSCGAGDSPAQSGAGPAPEQPKQKPARDNPRSVRALLRVRFSDPNTALNHDAVGVLLNSSGVARRAREEVLGPFGDEDRWGMSLSFTAPQGGEFSLTQNDDGVTLLG